MSLSSNFPAIRPSLLLDFQKSRAVDPRITFTRASTATYFDEDGILQSALANVPRIDFNPSTLVCNGLLIEEQRTNSIRNNTMQGAVAGSPGTLPTNWTYLEAGSELAAAVVGTGTESGITYIDLKVSGTVTAQRSALIFFESSTATSASQSWTESLYLKLQAGSTANIEQINIRTDYYNSTPTFISSTVGAALTVTTTALNTQRQSNSVTTPASTAFIQPMLRVRSNASGAIDITLRIGLPQLELGAFATSVIPTTTTALTRNADVASMTGTNFSDWYNASEGTVVIDCPANSSNVSITALTISDGTNSNRIFIGAGANNAAWNPFLVTSGTSQGSLSTGSSYPPQTNPRLAVAYKTDDSAACVSGVAPVVDTTVNLPVVNRMNIGASGVGTVGLNGTIRRIAYYPTRLPNTTLQALTG